MSMGGKGQLQAATGWCCADLCHSWSADNLRLLRLCGCGYGRRYCSPHCCLLRQCGLREVNVVPRTVHLADSACDQADQPNAHVHPAPAPHFYQYAGAMAHPRARCQQN